jgi:hypothetical protein
VRFRMGIGCAHKKPTDCVQWVFCVRVHSSSIEKGDTYSKSDTYAFGSGAHKLRTENAAKVACAWA